MSDPVARIRIRNLISWLKEFQDQEAWIIGDFTVKTFVPTDEDSLEVREGEIGWFHADDAGTCLR